MPNDAIMQIVQRSAVSTIIVMLIPSTPTKYSMLKAGIHGARRTNWKPGASAVKFRRSQPAMNSGGRLAATDTARMRRCARDGSASTTPPATSGTKIMRVSAELMLPSFLRSRGDRPRPVEQHAAQHAEDHDVEVRADRARLQVAHAAPSELRDGRDEVHEPVDDVEVEEARHPRPAADRGSGQVHEPGDHGEAEPRDDPAERDAATHEHEPVELVDPVLVQHDLVGRPAERVAERLRAERAPEVDAVREPDAG